jgi:V/A-type H+-transporting ATPase subunit I
MLLPEPMSRILVVGTKDRLKDTIELLYRLGDIHVVDFPAEMEGFTLGTPLPEASDASHKLLKLRSVEKDLDVEARGVKAKVPVREIEAKLDASIAEVEADISGVIESKNAKQILLSETENHIRELEPYQSIPLDIGMYHGYSSLTVLAGAVASDPSAKIGEALKNYEVFTNADQTFVVLFVDNAEAEEAQRVLVSHGFVEAPLPRGEGTPQENLARYTAQRDELTKELEGISARLDELKEKHAKFVVASDEYLSIVVEKAETPLRFGETEHSFIIDAWVPTADVPNIQKALADNFGDNIYLELIENKERTEEHAEGGEAMEAGALTAESVHVPEMEETPVKLKHTKTVGLFTFYTKLISTPRYNEIDPTIALAIFFPVFFGLMVGDVGYGIPFTILGWLGLRKAKSEDWRAIATMLFFGGIASIIFGLFLFGDMFGIEFVARKSGEIDWTTLLGVQMPHLGIWNKIDNVKTILWVTVWIGIFHLGLGTALGFYNVTLRHGLKHAVMEKFSWLMILAGAAILLAKVAPALVYPAENSLSLTSPLMLGGIGLLVVGLLLALKAEGGKAIVELPELLSNILSYTRIAAIGMSKAGMALAFNFIAIEMIAEGGGAMLVVGLLVFVVGHLMIFILAIISAGLHAVRLQYVELFTKFFEGGGQDFNPLKIKRKHTTEE